MAKARSHAQILARVQDGYGRGEGQSYKPWLGTRDLASFGLTSRIPGQKTGREHTVFSKGERNTFVIVQRIIVVRDIREQFPLLPLEETLALAKSLGVRHPMDKGEPVVMTTDFLITRVCSGDTSYEALSVKQKCMLEDPRVIEKLEIERLYWARYEVPWRIVTHEDVDCPLANNLHWINERWDVQDPSLNAEEIDILERRLFEYLTESNNEALRLVCLRCDDRFGFENGTCLSVVRHALARRLWIVPLNVVIDPSKPLKVLSRHRHPLAA